MLPQSRPQARTWKLLHASTEPPSGPHLAMAKYPGLGILPIFYLFSGPNFKFNFLSAAEATPLLGMDFLTKFGFSIISRFYMWLLDAPFPRTSTASLIKLWRPATSGGQFR
jgi:hypothetical protein